MKKLDTFDGHLVLWCKGHYSANDEVDIFDELKRIWAIRCGLDFLKGGSGYLDEYNIANRLYKILVACQPHKEKYLHELIHKALTSPIGYPEGLSHIQKLIYFYRSEIMNLQIYDVNQETGEKAILVGLPESQVEIFKRITNGDGKYNDYELINSLDKRDLRDCLVN